MVKAVKNLFPVEAETLNDFMDLVEKNGKPVEISPAYRLETSQNTIADNIPNSTMIIGKKYFVRLLSKTKEDKQIVHDIFCGFIAEMNDKSAEEKNLLEKTYSQAKAVLKTINLKLPNIPTKIVES